MFLSTQGLLNNLKTQSLLAGYETIKKEKQTGQNNKRSYTKRIDNPSKMSDSEYGKHMDTKQHLHCIKI